MKSYLYQIQCCTYPQGWDVFVKREETMAEALDYIRNRIWSSPKEKIVEFRVLMVECADIYGNNGS